MKTSDIIKKHFYSIGLSLLISLFIGSINYSTATGLENRQGSFIVLLVVVLLHIGYLIFGSTIYLLKIDRVKESKVLRVIAYFAGVLSLLLPTTILSLIDMAESVRGDDDITIVLTNLTVLVVWTIGYFRMERTTSANQTYSA